jgi:hypothetical protein
MANKNKKADKEKYALAAETNKRLGLISTILARNSARVKQLQDDTQASSTSAASKKTMLSLTTSLSIIASTLKRLNSTLTSLKSIKPITPGIVPVSAPAPATTSPDNKSQKDSASSLFKSLFTNPAVLTAVAGIAYLFLPKDVKDKLSAFFKGFNTGLDKAAEENEKLGTAVKVAGVAIATIFGVKLLGSVAQAIITTTKLIRLMGIKGKTGKKLGIAGALIAGGAAYAAVDALAEENPTEIDKDRFNWAAAPKAIREKYESERNKDTSEKPSPASTPYPKKEKKAAGITDRAVDAIEFFTGKGWTFEQAAGIVGNLQVESGANLDHTAYNSQEDAYGIAQWRGDRKTQFKKNYGKPIEQSTFKEQLEFVNWELNSDRKLRAAGAKLKDAKTVAEATEIVDKYYERSSGEHLDQRKLNAEELLRPLKNEPAKVSSTPVPATPANVTGKNISTASTEVKKSSQSIKSHTQVANINNSKQKTEREHNAPLPVPSPIANRGSLLNATKHSTAYV